MEHILVMSLKTFAHLNCWMKIELCPQLRMQNEAVEERKEKKR